MGKSRKKREEDTVYIFYIFTFSIFSMFFFKNLVCNSAFEQGHLEPWRYKNACIIIIIITIPSCESVSDAQFVGVDEEGTEHLQCHLP